MSDKWAKVKFDVSDRVLGCDVELREGKTVRLKENQTKDKVFREVSAGKTFDAYQMIAILLRKTNTRKQDLIKPAALAEAFEKGVCVGKPDLDMSFTAGSFELVSEGRDIARIVFDVELTVRPKKQS